MGDGVLVLSRFTGAARELRQALLINPYDREAFTETLATALAMPITERIGRMQALRSQVAGNNIYRWAGKMLTMLAALYTDNTFTTRGDDLLFDEAYAVDAGQSDRSWSLTT